MENSESNSDTTLEPLVSRKRKLEDIIRTEPTRVIRYPIRLWSAQQNKDIAGNFFELWLDDKYQPHPVYCQASRKIVSMHKRHNSNLVRHLKLHNHCNAPLREAADASTTCTSERDGESNGSKSEVATCDREGASAASASACEIEQETGSTPSTSSLLSNTLPDVELNHSGAGVALRFIIRGLSSSTYHIEAAPSDANLAASHTSTPQIDPTASTSEQDAQTETAATSSRSEPQIETTSSFSEPDTASTYSATDGDTQSSAFATEHVLESTSSATEHVSESASSATENLQQSTTSSVVRELLGPASLSEREEEVSSPDTLHATESNSLKPTGELYSLYPASVIEEESSCCESSSPLSGDRRRSSTTESQSNIEPISRPSPTKHEEATQGSKLSSVIASQPPTEDGELMQQVQSCDFNTTRLRPNGKRQEIPPPLISPNGRRIKQVKSPDIRSPVQASTQAEYEKYGEGFGVTIESEYQLKTD